MRDYNETPTNDDLTVWQSQREEELWQIEAQRRYFDAQATEQLHQRARLTLPEAPASVNVRVQIQGREVQITLRDVDEERLLDRLAKVLERFPVRGR